MESALLATGAAVGAVGAYGASVAAKDNPSTSSLRFTIEELQKEIKTLKEAQDICCKREAAAAAQPAPAPAVAEPAVAPASSQPGFFSRIFGPSSSAPASAPAPAPGPGPVVGTPVDVTGSTTGTASTEIESALADLESQPSSAPVVGSPVNVVGGPTTVTTSGTTSLESELADLNRQLPGPPLTPPPPPIPGPPTQEQEFRQKDREINELQTATIPKARAVIQEVEKLLELANLDVQEGGGVLSKLKSLITRTPKPVTPTEKPVTEQDIKDAEYHVELLDRSTAQLKLTMREYTRVYSQYADYAIRFEEKLSYVPRLKELLTQIATETKEVESKIRLVQDDLGKVASFEAAKEAEKTAVTAAQKAKTLEENKSTSIQDTLEEKTEAALKWYKETTSYFNKYIKDILILLSKRAPKDRSIDDKIIETGKFLDILNGKLPETDKVDDIGRGLAGLQKAYDDFNTEAGTQKSGIFGMTRKKKKYLDKEFKGEPSAPVPEVKYVRPVRKGGKKTRRRGGALQKLIDLKARIEAQLDYYNRVKLDVEAFREEADRFVNAKRDKYEYTIEEEPAEAPAPAAAAAQQAEAPVFPGAQFSSTNPGYKGKEGKEVLKALQQATTSSTRSTASSTPKATKSSEPAVVARSKEASKKPVKRREVLSSAPSSPTSGPTPAPNTGAAGTGLSSLPQASTQEIPTWRTDLPLPPLPPAPPGPPPEQPPSSSTIPTASVPGSLPPSLIPGFGTATRRGPGEVGGPLLQGTTQTRLGQGASRKKKLRSRRGGKQKNGRRTRRS